jgi:hypothetical protein
VCPNEPDLDASAAYESERLRRLYDRTAGEYDRWMRFHDRVMLGNGGRRVCSRASGLTLKPAIGIGLNLPFYPDGVPLTGVDLSPAVLAVAAWHVQTLGVGADLRLGDALAHDFPDDSFDTVVSTLFLSQYRTHGGQPPRPGGFSSRAVSFSCLDQVQSPIRPVRWVERLLDPPLRRFAGVHLLRNPLHYLGTVGLRLERCDRSSGGIVLDVVARKRGA